MWKLLIGSSSITFIHICDVLAWIEFWNFSERYLRPKFFRLFETLHISGLVEFPWLCRGYSGDRNSGMQLKNSSTSLVIFSDACIYNWIRRLLWLSEDGEGTWRQWEKWFKIGANGGKSILFRHFAESLKLPVEVSQVGQCVAHQTCWR